MSAHALRDVAHCVVESRSGNGLRKSQRSNVAASVNLLK